MVSCSGNPLPVHKNPVEVIPAWALQNGGQSIILIINRKATAKKTPCGSQGKDLADYLSTAQPIAASCLPLALTSQPTRQCPGRGARQRSSSPATASIPPAAPPPQREAARPEGPCRARTGHFEPTADLHGKPSEGGGAHGGKKQNKSIAKPRPVNFHGGVLLLFSGERGLQIKEKGKTEEERQKAELSTNVCAQLHIVLQNSFSDAWRSLCSSQRS